MADTSKGFRVHGSGNSAFLPEIPIVSADSAFAAGDMVNLESNKADLAAAGDGALYGIVVTNYPTLSANTSTIYVYPLYPDTIFSAYYTPAAGIGDRFEISGTVSGALTVAPSGTGTNNQFVVVANKSTTESEVLLRVNVGKGHFTTAVS